MGVGQERSGQRVQKRRAGAFSWNMAVAGLTNSVVLRCDLGWEDVREVMETSRLLTLMRRSWMVAGLMFTALLAESVVLLRMVAARPASYGSHQGSLLGELIAAACLCGLLVCWSTLRVWRLSPRHQARHCLAGGGWESGGHQFHLRGAGLAGEAPDGFFGLF